MSEAGENSLFIKVILLVGGAIGLVAITWGIISLSSPDSDSSSDAISGEVSEDLPEVTEEDHIFGEEDAPITIVKYSDFQCPACAQFESVLDRVLEEYPEDVRIVYRHFPLRSIHANAERAGRAAEAAALQGEFQEYHDEVFDTQSDWSGLRGGELDEFFVEIARGLDLDLEQFEADYESEEVKEAVREDLRGAQQLGLTSTPSFYLNEVRIQNPNGYQAFAELIDEEIERLESESGAEGKSEQEESEGENETPEDAEETKSNE